MTQKAAHGKQSQSSTHKIIKISQELSNYIESLHYELSARQDLLSFLVRNNLQESEGFKRYHEEYIDFYTQYQLAKSNLENDILIPLIGGKFSWTLDFSSQEVTIIEE